MSRIQRTTGLVMLVAALSAISNTPMANASPSPLTKHKVIVATGSVTCTKVTGSVTFSPAVRHIGTTPETQVLTFRASGCSTKRSNVKHVTSGYLTATVHRPLSSCIDLLSTELPKGTGTWKPSSIHSTTASFSGLAFVHNNAGTLDSRCRILAGRQRSPAHSPEPTTANVLRRPFIPT